MFKTTSATEEKNAQEVVIYNHRDRDIESEAPVNPTSANTNTNTDEAAAADEAEAEAEAVALFSSKQTQWRCFSKKNMVVCGVACAFVGVAVIVGAASASVRSSKQMQESYAEAIVDRSRGKERKSGKNKSLDFTWLEGRYSCLKESGITPKVGGISGAVVVEDNVVQGNDIDDGERCPTRAQLLIVPALRVYSPQSSPAGVAEIQDFLGEIQDEADVANIVAAVAAAAASVSGKDSSASGAVTAAASVSGKDSSASGAVTFVAIFSLKPLLLPPGQWLTYVFNGVGSYSGDDEITLYTSLSQTLPGYFFGPSEDALAYDDALEDDDFEEQDEVTLKVTKSSKNGGTIAVDFYDSFWPDVYVETARSYLFEKTATMYPTSSPIMYPTSSPTLSQ